MWNQLLVLTVFAVAVVSMPGCGGPSAAPDANVEPAMTAPASTTPVESTSLPADFPKDVPLYEGFQVEAVSALPASGTYVIQGRTADVMEKVEVTLRQAAESQGWTVPRTTAPAPISDMAILSFEKPDRMLSITLLRDDTGTSINLTTGAKK